MTENCLLKKTSRNHMQLCQEQLHQFTTRLQLSRTSQITLNLYLNAGLVKE